MISACSSLSTSFLKSKSGSRIEEGCDALFCLLFFVIEVLESSLRFLSSFVFFQSWILSEYAFRTNVSILTASCLFVSFDCLRISLHKTL